MNENKAFREYATRVSFNMTLSRNQIFALRTILLEIETSNFEQRHSIYKTMDVERRALGMVDNYVTGARTLERMGIVEPDPRWTADEKRLEDLKKQGKHALKQYWGPSWRLTEAGEHVLALLQIAGLIQLPQAVANNNKRERRRA